jgi:pyruvate carboxylase
MAEIEKKPVKIVETILRDAHQSLIATRMTTEQMLPIIEKMDQVGYHAVECWGGATFDASLRFLKEDPWERLRKFRDGFKNTKLQMLFRGQNILGYRPYADDVVEYFVQKSAANGIDIIAKYFDVSKENIISVGDNYNDLPMFEKSGYSIAMGNSVDEVKKQADYVTDDILQDGIYNAFKNLNII